MVEIPRRACPSEVDESFLVSEEALDQEDKAED